MTPPRRQNEGLKYVMAARDCLAPGGTLVAVVSPDCERPASGDRIAVYFNAGLGSFIASGGTARRHLQRVRTADAIAAHLGGKKNHLLSEFRLGSLPYCLGDSEAF